MSKLVDSEWWPIQWESETDEEFACAEVLDVFVVDYTSALYPAPYSVFASRDPDASDWIVDLEDLLSLRAWLIHRFTSESNDEVRSPVADLPGG